MIVFCIFNIVIKNVFFSLKSKDFLFLKWILVEFLVLLVGLMLNVIVEKIFGFLVKNMLICVFNVVFL